MIINEVKNSLKGLFPNGFNKSIWGISYEDAYIDGIIWRGINIEKTFYYKGYRAIGINQKLIKDCWKSQVEKLIVFIGQIPPYSEYTMVVPNEQTIKWLEKEKQYEDKPSKFDGGQPMKIYYFRIEK
jgi:ribonucleotide reductase beta subunit family protein with ferritin-like domain